MQEKRSNWEILIDMTGVQLRWLEADMDLKLHRDALARMMQNAKVRQGRMSNVGLVALRQAIARVQTDLTKIQNCQNDIYLLAQGLQGD